LEKKSGGGEESVASQRKNGQRKNSTPKENRSRKENAKVKNVAPFESDGGRDTSRVQIRGPAVRGLIAKLKALLRQRKGKGNDREGGFKNYSPSATGHQSRKAGRPGKRRKGGKTVF